MTAAGGRTWRAAAAGGSGATAGGRRTRSFMLAEVLASWGVVLVLLVLLALTVQVYAGVRREFDTRRLLWLAADTELNRIRAGLVPVPGADGYETAPPQPSGARLRVTAVSGPPGWDGLLYVRVAAEKSLSPRRVLRVDLAGCVPVRPEGRP